MGSRGHTPAGRRSKHTPPACPRWLPPLSLQGNDYALRYHDLHSNRYIRYFRGHAGRITTLSMSPKSDVFLSAAQDKTVGWRRCGRRVCMCRCFVCVNRCVDR